MRKNILWLCALTILASCSTSKETKSYNEGINIIPQPAELSVTDTLNFTLTAGTAIVSGNEFLTGDAQYLADKLKSSTGFALSTLAECPESNYIKLTIDKALTTGKEGYTLNSSPKGVEIAASTETGIFYGIQTFLQLFPAEIESQTIDKSVNWEIPSVKIVDYPRFAYRGHMMDVCRHFRSVEMIKKEIDVLCMYKINRLHWHLTEDQAWRIEIKKFPKLTELGSVRTEGDGQKYGPFFYTQEQITEVVKYAASRHIEVIPEIEMPGHGMAALTAYPEFSCTGGPFAQPRIIWGVEDEVYCVGNDATFEFLEDILREVSNLFPSKYIHLGGDECPKARWKECPKCQARARELRLRASEKHSVEEQLQSYFVTRMEKFVNSLGKQIIGWDEILEGGLAPSATVMSWRGIEGGLAAASQDHDVIMTPGSGGLYIDHLQGPAEVEPVSIGGMAPYEKTYMYEPIPEALAENMRHHILGAQCNLWTEYVIDDNHWEYMMYPRVIAVAELTWTPKEKKDLESFTKRLNNTYVRLDKHGVTYHIPMPVGTLTNNVAFLDDSTNIEFSNTGDYPMVYTLDGKDPKSTSKVYDEPITVSGEGTIKIATMLPSGVLSNVRTITYAHEEPLAPQTEAQFDETGLNAERGVAVLNIAPGLYPKEEDWAKARFEEKKVVTKMHDGEIWDMNKPSLATFEGYFFADTTGVYTFSTDDEELWIDGQRIILNEKLSRHYKNKAQIALAAGPHYYKLLFNNMIKDGWPNSWSVIGFRYLRPGGGFRDWRNADSNVLTYSLSKKPVKERIERRERRPE